MSSPGASPRDVATGLKLASTSLSSCSSPDFIYSPIIPSPLNPSPHLRQAPLQSPGGGIVPPHQRRSSFSQSYFSIETKCNLIPPRPILDSDVARRSIEASLQTSPRQSVVEQSMMSIGTSSAGSTPYVHHRSFSGSFNQSSSPSLSGYHPPSLAASPVLEAPPPQGSVDSLYTGHRRSSSHNFPATGGGPSTRPRSSTYVYSPSTPDHRNSHSFSHSPSPRSQSSSFCSPAMSMHSQSFLPSLPVPSTPPRHVPSHASGSFADRDDGEVDYSTRVQGNVVSPVTPPGRPPRHWWNMTVPWNGNEWWNPGDFVYQDESRVKHDERLNPVRPAQLYLPPGDAMSNGEAGGLTIRPLCVGIAEAEREREKSKSIFASFRWYSFSQRTVVCDDDQGKYGDKESDHKSKALSHFTGAEVDGFNRARKNVILACYSVLTRDERTFEKDSTASCVFSTTGTIIEGALPALKTILELTYSAAALVPVPFFLEASRTLLIIWEACEQLSSNRLSCLRIVERCAGMLYFVREQIEGVGPIVGKELDTAFHVFREVIFQIEGFLCRISRRPMLKRFIRRAEIAKELCNCDQALMDAWLTFYRTAGTSDLFEPSIKAIFEAVEQQRRLASAPLLSIRFA